MKIKVEDVKPELPPDTLRKINNWIHWNIYPCAMKGLNMCMMHKSIGITRQCGGGNHYLDCKIPLYCTSIDAALGLCRKMYIHMEITLWGDGEASVELVEHQTKTEKVSIAELCGGRGLSDIPCAVVRALLKSQNVTEVEV